MVIYYYKGVSGYEYYYRDGSDWQLVIDEDGSMRWLCIGSWRSREMCTDPFIVECFEVIDWLSDD